MQISKLWRSSDRIENGGWVGAPELPIPELGDLRLKVRGIGNKGFEAIRREVLEGMSYAEKRDGMSLETAEALTVRQLSENLLMGWENLQAEPDGPAVPYTPEVAVKLISDPDYLAFRLAIMWAAEVVGARREGDDASVKAWAGRTRAAGTDGPQPRPRGRRERRAAKAA